MESLKDARIVTFSIAKTPNALTMSAFGMIDGNMRGNIFPEPYPDIETIIKTITIILEQL